MTVDALLENLRNRGVDVTAQDGKLRVSAPRGALTEDLRQELSARKSELLAALNRVNGNGNGHGALLMPPTIDEGPGSASHADLYRRRFDNDDERSALLEATPPYTQFVNPCQGYMYAMIDMDKRFVRGRGCSLFDEHGNEYLDFIAAYGALPFGHNPDAVWDALDAMRRDEAPNFIQPSILDAAGNLAERLISVAPDGLRYVTFANSGAESVEAAIKLCRSATQRTGILSTLNSFHGKTLGALSATGKRVYQKAFSAPAEGFHYIPFGDAEALEAALAARPRYYAGFIVEPIQGEGGIVEPPAGYLAEASSICKRHDTPFVVDEVQTGLGRTGTMFACEHEGVSPDVMTLAKALGGGLAPIGAVLCTDAMYNEEFATQHTSTFGGNTLSCRAGMATLDLIAADDAALVGNARDTGEYLRGNLAQLVERYPRVGKAVRGKGLLLGLQFNLDSELFEHGFMRYLCDQAVFTYMLSAYLLNVHGIRVAPTLSAPDVLRIEPPLTVTRNECDKLVEALDETMRRIDGNGAAQLIAHLIGVDVRGRTLPPPPPNEPERIAVSPVHPRPTEPGEGRFGFVTHLDEAESWTQLDPCLGVFTQDEMSRLKHRVLDMLDPVPVGEIEIESPSGRRARGEFVMLPFAASEIVEMPYDRALAEIRYAVQLLAQRGAKVVGLGGFNSVITQGGLTLADENIVPLSTGNSYTAVAGAVAIEQACEERGLPMETSAACVIGAGGAVGKAVALLLAERVARIQLVGNPAHPKRSLARLEEVAAAILKHLWNLQSGGREFADGSIGHRLGMLRGSVPEQPGAEHFQMLAQDFIRREERIALSTDVTEQIRVADIIATATNSVDNLAKSDAFKKGAIVCELSRPFNFDDAVREARSDVRFIDGGVTRVPGGKEIGLRNGLPKGTVFACVAETIMLALEDQYDDTSLGADLDAETLATMRALAERHDFRVVI